MLPFAFLVLSRVVSALGPVKTPVTGLVTFGDSYTDLNFSNGGSPWPVYAAAYGGFSVIDVAVSGAVCNQTIVNRASPVLPYQYQQYVSRASDIDYDSTVYSIWIGTNDVRSIIQMRNFFFC